MDYRTNKHVPLGNVLITPQAQLYADRHGHLLEMYIQRHACGNWGDAVTEDEWRDNDIALRMGLAVMSAHTLSGGQQIYIRTDRYRSTTMVYLAEDG